MKNLVAIALLSTAIVSGAAYAQQAQPADRAAPAATLRRKFRKDDAQE